jgi:hypothetical protein
MFYKIIRKNKEGKIIAIKDYDDEETALKKLREVKVDPGMEAVLWAKQDRLYRDGDRLVIPNWYWIAKKVGNGTISTRTIDPFDENEFPVEDLDRLWPKK